MLFFTEISQQRTRQPDIFFGVMTATMVGLGLWCALSGDVRFVATDAGRQFVYTATPPFLTMLAVYGFLASLQILSAIRWYRESLLKRRRKEARIFCVTLAITGPLALPFDFLVPTLMGRAIVPLTSVIMIFASVRLYWVMKAHWSFNVTSHKVSEYLFSALSFPVLVTNADSCVELANPVAESTWPGALMGEHMSTLIQISASALPPGLLKQDFSGLRATLHDGSATFDILQRVTRDEFGDIISKTIVLTDITRRQNALMVAESASRVKSEFRSRISHELRTPSTPSSG